MRRRALLALPAVALLPACAVKMTDLKQKVDVPQTWLGQGGDAPMRADWWQVFGDPVLTGLVEQALKRNLDLLGAAARLQEARAMAAAERGAEFPSLDAGGGISRSRSVSDVTLEPYLSTGREWEFQASYEIDLWGRLSALTKAADAGSAAARDARDAVALSVAATVADSYFSLRATDAQIELTEKTLASRKKTFEIMRDRAARGYSSELESKQAEAQWRATAEVIPQLRAAARQQERAIDVLLARVPTSVNRGQPLLSLALPDVPATGVPSDLLRRRPDIAGAEEQVAAADAQLHAARARLLPSLKLTGMLGTVQSSVLTGDPFTVWELGGSVLAPIFHGGQLRALARASESRRDQAILAYEKAVISSFSEVETQLANLAAQKEQLALAQQRRTTVADSLRIATHRVDEGYASFLDQLTAEEALFAVDQTVIQLHASVLVSEVGVYRALGGGWSVQSGDEVAPKS